MKCSVAQSLFTHVGAKQTCQHADMQTHGFAKLISGNQVCAHKADCENMPGLKN